MNSNEHIQLNFKMSIIKYCFNLSCPNSIHHNQIKSIEFNEYVKNQTLINEPILIYLCDDCRNKINVQIFCGFCEMEMYDNWIEVDFTPICRHCLPSSEFNVSLVESLKQQMFKIDIPRSIEFYSRRDRIRRIRIRSINDELDYYYFEDDKIQEMKDRSLDSIFECNDIEYLHRIFSLD